MSDSNKIFQQFSVIDENYLNIFNKIQIGPELTDSESEVILALETLMNASQSIRFRTGEITQECQESLSLIIDWVNVNTERLTKDELNFMAALVGEVSSYLESVSVQE